MGAQPSAADTYILGHLDFTSFNSALQSAHNSAHGYIGGTLGHQHFFFHDPMVFLLHSNMDRLWAAWQRTPGRHSRLNPATAYDTILADEGLPSTYFDEWAQPSAGVNRDGSLPIPTEHNPWKSEVSQQAHTSYNHPSVTLFVQSGFGQVRRRYLISRPGGDIRNSGFLDC